MSKIAENSCHPESTEPSPLALQKSNGPGSLNLVHDVAIKGEKKPEKKRRDQGGFIVAGKRNQSKNEVAPIFIYTGETLHRTEGIA